MKSIVSYPDRGKWGDNKYRGNCQIYPDFNSVERGVWSLKKLGTRRIA